jgi:hypothetical protein
MSYEPPEGDQVGLELGPAYTPPDGNKVGLELATGALPPGDDQYLFPSAWQSFEPGAATVWNWIQYIAPSGPDSFTAGTAEVETGPNFTQFVGVPGASHGAFGDFTTQQTGEFPVLPTGWHTEAFGNPWVSLWHQFVEHQGDEHTRFGTANIYIPPPQFVMASGKDSMAFGAAFVAWQLRWVSHVGHGHLSLRTGTPRVTHRVQPVQVPWSVFTQYGSTKVSRQIEFSPAGWESWAAGGATVGHGNVLYPAGWVSSTPPPIPWLSRSPRHLGHTQSVPATEWGMPDLYLWVRYLGHSGFPAETQGTQFGTYTHILNRNREVAPYGFVATRMPITATVQNAARALGVLPMDETRWGGGTFVAPGIRHVPMQGFTAFRASNFGTAIYNAAMQIRPAGWHTEAVGKPEWVESNLQVVRQHSGPVTAFGQAFVAPAVRMVAQYGWLSALHKMGYPRVWFNRVRPAGFDAAGVGQPALLGPIIRTIAPSWIQRNYVGHPDVRNNTPQIYPPGRPYSEFGAAWVSFRVRTLSPGGIWEFAIGRPAIRDRSHYPAAHGWDSFISSPFAHQVRNVDPDPPSTRIVAPTSIYTSDESNWRQFYSAYIGKPTVGANSVWPEGIASQRFGNADMRRQGAIVEMHAPMTRWGEYFETRVEHRNRGVSPEGIPRSDIPFGKPRLSPHTIWAPLGAPHQAVLNHPTPNNPLHAVGGLEPAGYADSRWPWFGHTSVTNRIQQVVQYHDSSSQAVGRPNFGELTVVEWRQRIRLHDNGIDSQRFGQTVLHPHTKRIWGVGLLSQRFGAHEVELGDKRQWVNAGSLYGTLFGTAFLWGGLRYVFAHGAQHTQWGDNNPMVHYPRRFEIGGGELTRWGADTWVSQRVRHLFPEGFQATEADWVDFRARMRVMHRHRPAVAGFNSMRVGLPTVSLKQQVAAPYMIPPPGMCSLGLEVRHG